MSVIVKTLGAATVVASTLLTAAPSHAQSWPQRSVKLILPLGPGSGVDITARLVGERLSAKWGQSVVIENKPGGDGVVAITTFVGGKDDHSLLMSPTSSFTHHPWTHDKMPYEANEFVPVVRMTNTIVGVAVPSSLPFKTMGDLIAYAKANPGKLNWATITGFFDFVFDGFQKKAGLQIAKVPYRNTVQAATDLAEGRIELMMSAYAILRPHVEFGKASTARRHRVAARVDIEGRAHHGGGRLPRHYDRRPGRHLRAPRHAACRP